MEEQFKELVKNATPKELEALKAAVVIIYLNDSSDYLNGLFDVVKALVGTEIFYDDDFNVDDMQKILRSDDTEDDMDD